MVLVDISVRGGRSEAQWLLRSKSWTLADRPSFVPSLDVIGGDEPISGRSGFNSGQWHTNIDTARSDDC